MTLPPLPVGAMNRTLSLVPSQHAALSPAPPSSRHVVGVKALGIREKLGLKSASILPLRRWVSPPPRSRQLETSLINASVRVLLLWSPWEGVNGSILCGRGGCFSMLPASFLPLCRSSPLQTPLGPLLASPSRGLVVLQARHTGRDPRCFLIRGRWC